MARSGFVYVAFVVDVYVYVYVYVYAQIIVAWHALSSKHTELVMTAVLPPTAVTVAWPQGAQA